VRHGEIIHQLPRHPRREGWEMRLGRGVALLLIGLVKKLFLASRRKRDKVMCQRRQKSRSDVDQTWRRGDGRIDLSNPFPSGSTPTARSTMPRGRGANELEELRGGGARAEAVARTRTAGSGRRLRRLRGRPRLGGGRGRRAHRAAARHRGAGQSWAPMPDFAPAPLLRDLLARLPAATRVVLVFPPRHRHAIARPGTAAAAGERACTAAFTAIAAARPGMRTLDFIDRDGMTEDEDFWDLVHYRTAVARRMETEIAAALGPR
jgi:hypothetical protein